MNQSKMKKIAPIIIAIIAAGGVFFYGGMKYQEGKSLSRISGQGNFQNLSPEERQQLFQQPETGARGTRIDAGVNGVRVGANSANGEIISKDDKSITVKLRDGGSKIVFFSDTTQISKMAEGSRSDVEIGEQVIVSGSANSDGSITANTIQLRPSLPPAPLGSSAPSAK